MEQHTNNNEPTTPINPTTVILLIGIAALLWLPIIATAFWAGTVPDFIINPMDSFVNWTGLGILLPSLWFIAIAFFSLCKK